MFVFVKRFVSHFFVFHFSRKLFAFSQSCNLFFSFSISHISHIILVPGILHLATTLSPFFSLFFHYFLCCFSLSLSFVLLQNFLYSSLGPNLFPAILEFASLFFSLSLFETGSFLYIRVILLPSFPFFISRSLSPSPLFWTSEGSQPWTKLCLNCSVCFVLFALLLALSTPLFPFHLPFLHLWSSFSRFIVFLTLFFSSFFSFILLF